MLQMGLEGEELGRWLSDYVMQNRLERECVSKAVLFKPNRSDHWQFFAGRVAVFGRGDPDYEARLSERGWSFGNVHFLQKADEASVIQSTAGRRSLATGWSDLQVALADFEGGHFRFVGGNGVIGPRWEGNLHQKERGEVLGHGWRGLLSFDRPMYPDIATTAAAWLGHDEPISSSQPPPLYLSLPVVGPRFVELHGADGELHVKVSEPGKGKLAVKVNLQLQSGKWSYTTLPIESDFLRVRVDEQEQ